MGENIIRMGDNGKGLVMKICHNALVSQIQNGVNETSLLAAANGIDILTFAQAISYGGGQNFYLDSKKQVIANEDFTTGILSCEYAQGCSYLPESGKAVRILPCRVKKMPRVSMMKRWKRDYGGEDFCATVKVVKEGKPC